MAGIGFASAAPASAGIKRYPGVVDGGNVGAGNTKTALANSAIQQLLGGNTGISGAPGVTQGMPTPRTAAATPPAAPAATAPTTNTANPNPTSNTAINNLQALATPNQAATTATSALEGLSKANAAGTQATQGLFEQANNKSGLYGTIDQNIQDIRDKASFGIAGDQQGSRIQRGVSGSSIDNSDKRALNKAQQNDINRMTTDATLGWEKERSNNLQAAGSMGLNTSAQQIGAAGAAGQMGLANTAQQVGTNATAGQLGLGQGAQQLAQQQEARAQQNQIFQQQQQQEAAQRESQMQGWNTILNLLS